MLPVSADAGPAGPLTAAIASSNESSRSRSNSLGYLQNRLQRSLTKTRLGRSDTSKTVQTSWEAKGPLGLTLLHEPSEPQIDFVFVHGLGGGSKKTWTYSPDPGMFWPKEWLPNEVGFKHVRLHSYGYNSDWKSRKGSPLAIHDFGQALLADLHNCKSLRNNGETPIVLVAHSMGGLVAKKAYLLATRDPTYQPLAERIRAMYFLGTPHRGASSANVARLIQQSAGYGHKAYLDDLIPGCSTLDQINEEFRHSCASLQIWSFSEAIPTKFGLNSYVVVDKESATLGLPKEHIQYLEADHRNICRFDSPGSPNYLILQRAFLATIENMGASISSQRREGYRSEMKKVAALLQVDQRPDATLLATNEKQHPGSCQWLTEHPVFLDWINDNFEDWEELELTESPDEKTSISMTPPPILWLHGRPGTGKSVATSHVVRYLQSCNYDCSFYFFRHEDKSSSNIASLLRSLAFQMAESSIQIRRAIVSMAEDDIRVNTEDHHMLWTNLFVERIFKADHVRPQHWVLDAIDECSKKAIPALISMLSSLDFKVPVRVFMTSRPSGEVGKHISAVQPRMHFSEMKTGDGGSLRDIELFLNARCTNSGSTSAYRGLVADILSRSSGIFLWASLTIAKMEDAYSVEDKHDVLRQIPPQMDDFYARIVASVADSPSADLAKCVLTWVICSPRPLHLDEITEAVGLDIGRTLAASVKQLEAMTGHLIIVDQQLHVRMAHQTMSSFLTQPKDHDFWVDRTAAHSRITDICLDICCGSDFSPPRMRRGGALVDRGEKETSHLADYAALNFSYHLVHGTSAAESTLLLLNKFLRSNILTFIDRIASKVQLAPLIQTAQRLKTYLARREKYQSPLSVESRMVSSWASDIYHITAAFHANLLTSPKSIYSIIPHLCPPKSAIWELFAKPSKRLQIKGPVEEYWNDRLVCFLFPEDASSVACGSRLLAVGLCSGEIKLYSSGEQNHSRSFGTPFGTLHHGKNVRQLAFSLSADLLASASARKLALWDVRAGSGSKYTCLWSKQLDFTPSTLEFHPSDGSIILTNHQSSCIVTFDCITGQKDESTLLHAASDSDSVASSDSNGQQVATWTPAELMRLDSDKKLAALSYRNAAVTIWDLAIGEPIGTFEKEGCEDVYASIQAIDMIFNPIAELELLAVAYKDGDIVTCNPWTLETVNSLEFQVYLESLAATSDGRILAGAAEDGGIHLFLFETLQPVYQIARPDSQLRIYDVAFSTDNLRFFDVRGQSCNVWEPQVLVPRDGSDDTSSEPHSEEVVVSETSTSQAHVFEWEESITVIDHTVDGKILFVGRQDGSIDVCDASSGEAVERLRLHHSFAEIVHVEWNEKKSCLLSLDSTGRYMVHRICDIGKESVKAKVQKLFDQREPSNVVHQALLGPEACSILLSTASNTRLITYREEEENNAAAESCLQGRAWWAQHPTAPSRLIAIQDGTIQLFDWRSLECISLPQAIPLPLAAVNNANDSSEEGFDLWARSQCSSHLVINRLSSDPQRRFDDVFAIDTSKLDSEESASLQVLGIKSTKLNFQQLIGCFRSSLYYLDTGGWICSISRKHYMRHFFIPPTWRTGSNSFIKVISKTALALGRGEQLFVFHGFLEFEEKIAL